MPRDHAWEQVGQVYFWADSSRYRVCRVNGNPNRWEIFDSYTKHTTPLDYSDLHRALDQADWILSHT